MTAVVDPLLTVLADIATERRRQDADWGEQNHPDGTGDPYWTDMARHARFVCHANANAGTVKWLHILREEVYEAFAENDPAKLRAELVQVAAVVAAWIEAIDRRSNRAASGSSRRAQDPAVDLVEQLSEAAHNAWMETKRAQGVTSRNSEWGEDLMVPYADLSERAKDLDRGTVRGVLAAIERAGYRVTPKFAQGGPVERSVDFWLGPPRHDTVRLADLDLQQDGRHAGCGAAPDDECYCQGQA